MTPGAPRGKGRFGFITVVFLMVGAAILLTVSAGNRHAMVAWGELPHEKSISRGARGLALPTAWIIGKFVSSARPLVVRILAR